MVPFATTFVSLAHLAARLAGKEMYLKSEQPAMRSWPRHPYRFQLIFCIRMASLNFYRRVNGMIQLTFVRIMIDLSDQPSLSQFFSLAWARPDFYNTARIRIRRIKEMERKKALISPAYIYAECWWRSDDLFRFVTFCGSPLIQSLSQFCNGRIALSFSALFLKSGDNHGARAVGVWFLCWMTR